MEIQYNKALHRYSLFVAFSTFCLVIAGGLVTSTGSGLAVPDWPLSYGMVMPPMVGGIFYEHTHRLVATFVGLLTIILAAWLWRKEQRRWLRHLGLVALGAVVFQGLLGGLTVYLLLPTVVSVAHATLAQTFFCTVVSIALFTSRGWIEGKPVSSGSRELNSLFPLSLAAAIAIYFQLIIGALMRHTHSGLAIPDFPLAYGQLFPSLSPGSLATYNGMLEDLQIRTVIEDPVTASQIVVHMLHRVWALMVAGLVIGTSIRVYNLGSLSGHLRVLAPVLLVILLLQISLGAWSVLSRKAVEVTTAHVAGGAVMLAVSVLIVLQISVLRDKPAERLSFRGLRGEAVT